MKIVLSALCFFTFSQFVMANTSRDACQLDSPQVQALVDDLSDVRCIDREKQDPSERPNWARDLVPITDSVLVGGENQSGDYLVRAIILSENGNFKPHVVGKDIRKVFANDNDVQAMRIVSISNNSYTVLSFISRRPERLKISSVYGTVYSPGVKATCEIFRGPYEKNAIVSSEGPVRPDYYRYRNYIAMFGGEVTFPSSNYVTHRLDKIEFIKRIYKGCYKL